MQTYGRQLGPGGHVGPRKVIESRCPGGFHQSVNMHMKCLQTWVIQHSLSEQDVQGPWSRGLCLQHGQAVERCSCLYRQAGGMRYCCMLIIIRQC